MLNKYDFDKLAEEASDALLNDETPLNASIKIIAIRGNLNPEHIKRLCEASNIKTYNKMFDSLEDKTFEFDPADSSVVIDEVYSDNSDEVAIKDMPDVKYEPTVNPKNPESTDEVLGDDDELEVSKNVMHTEDAAGDSMMDAMSIPAKDYSFSDHDSDIDVDPAASIDPEDAEKEKLSYLKLRKEAALDAFPKILKELEKRCMLLTDSLVDELDKTAALFRGLNREDKFKLFEKNAKIIYQKDKEAVDTLFRLLKDTVKISAEENELLDNGIKVASSNAYGMKSFGRLLNTFIEYEKTNTARELVEKEILGDK